MADRVRLPIANNAPFPPAALRPSEDSSPVVALAATSDSAIEEGEGGLQQIGELAKEAGKTVRTIHLYEELGLLRPAARSKGRYRLYGQDALLRVRWISKLQEMGFSLTDIQTVVREWELLGSAPKAMVEMRRVYEEKLKETRENLLRLRALESELQASLHYLDACDVCDPARILSACQCCDHHDHHAAVPELVRGFRATS